MEFTKISGTLKDKTDAKAFGEIIEVAGIKHEIVEVHIAETWDENEVFWFEYGLKKQEITNEDLQKL